MTTKKEEQIKLDTKKLQMMKIKIIALERQNVNTRSRTEGEMIGEIRNIIISETNKNI